MSELNFPWKTGMKYVAGGDFIPSDLQPSTTSNMYNSAPNPVIDVKVNTSSCTDMQYMFSDAKMYAIDSFDTSNVTNMQYMFSDCDGLVTIPQLDTTNVTNMIYFLNYCKNVYEIPMLDTSNVLSMSNLLRGAKIITFPQWNMSKVTDVSNLFNDCKWLIDVPELDWGAVKTCQYPFGTANLSTVANLGGFKDLGKEKSISGTTSYFLNVVPNLTHESLMNVINKLYDRKTAGYSTLSLKFGSTNLGKLTDEEKAIATNKGYTLTS